MENDMKNELILYCKNNKQIRLPADPENINTLEWIKNNSTIYKNVPQKTVVGEQSKLFMPSVTKKRGRKIFELSERYIADKQDFNELVDRFSINKKLKVVSDAQHLRIEPLSHQIALKIAKAITNKSWLQWSIETTSLSTELKSLRNPDLVKEIIVKHVVLTHFIKPDRFIELGECFSPRFSSGCNYALGDGTEHADEDNTVFVWDLKDGKFIEALFANEDSIFSLAYNENAGKCIIGGTHGSLGFYSGAAEKDEDWKSEEIVSTHNQDEIWACELSNDGSLAVSSGQDCTLRVWDTSMQKELWSDKLEEDTGFTQCAFSQDNSQLLVGANDYNARVYESRTGKKLFTLVGHEGGVGAVAVSPDQGKYATGSEDGTARLWDSKDGRCISVLGLHTDVVCCVAFSPDGRYVATGGEDGKVCLWHANEGEFIFTIETRCANIKDIKFLPNQLLICTADSSHNAVVTTYDIEKLVRISKSINVPGSLEDLLLLVANLIKFGKPALCQPDMRYHKTYDFLRVQYEKLAGGKNE